MNTFAPPLSGYHIVLPAQLGSVTQTLAVVDALRANQAAQPQLHGIVMALKRSQCARFSCTYADALSHSDWQPAAQFFLTELYGDRDFSSRDHQFGRIAPAMQSLFPVSVLAAATTLVHLHAVSEQLDYAMAIELQSLGAEESPDAAARTCYVRAWRQAQQRDARNTQLELVQRLGYDLIQLTRIPGLRTMLRLMRGPASAAGLQHLQNFLELGFDTFATMQRSKAGAAAFLVLVNDRELAWMNRLFDIHISSVVDTTNWPELG